MCSILKGFVHSNSVLPLSLPLLLPYEAPHSKELSASKNMLWRSCDMSDASHFSTAQRAVCGADLWADFIASSVMSCACGFQCLRIEMGGLSQVKGGSRDNENTEFIGG